MRAVGVIPARLGSTRLPRKVLALLDGKPLVWHVWQRARRATSLLDVIVATDAAEVAAVVEGFGGRAIMTDADCPSGTARLASIAHRLDADFVVNIQGDEPLLDAALLDALVERAGRGASLVTAARPIATVEELCSPHVVKVVRAANGDALYFSRSPLPYVRDLPQTHWLAGSAAAGPAAAPRLHWAHVGLYGYTPAALAAYAAAPPSPLEQAEQLEQLRFVELGERFAVVETEVATRAVDTAEDLHAVAALLALHAKRNGDSGP